MEQSPDGRSTYLYTAHVDIKERERARAASTFSIDCSWYSPWELCWNRSNGYIDCSLHAPALWRRMEGKHRRYRTARRVRYSTQGFFSSFFRVLCVFFLSFLRLLTTWNVPCSVPYRFIVSIMRIDPLCGSISSHGMIGFVCFFSSLDAKHRLTTIPSLVVMKGIKLLISQARERERERKCNLPWGRLINFCGEVADAAPAAPLRRPTSHRDGRRTPRPRAPSTHPVD